ncbi:MULTISPECIES: hypothetical protein [Rhizobium/Agrobacterium group]|jgi:hypothetical protein|uniref:Uncharacterized protein n=2 Tax=Rhizobium/Agrobacterium group TaxID=227290 RepID=A0A546XP36_RHIRH|nr:MULTISPECIES: hypothetical protein [Rhizobium/Agrobacterium group]MCZ7463354.1 hypothetical protein [Rhizobium rhizogenes]MCZ7467923.1 hypothetical protein [Rhizobium rhizogenes]MCZ7479047.1 hypothetical protein [Rhizobium rhizogenes]MCZ7485124.1 hypothetical protein [Rhizobium rhizogenes]TRB02497.1 hypothetical protein EXN68_02080 [Rhizobium rhizogenes]
MIDEYGPYVQMGTLAEQMATRFQMDANLELGSHLSHYMDEVEVNIAADRFDHVGFMNKIRGRLTMTLATAAEPRRREFLHAVVVALQERIDRHSLDVAVDGV